MNKSVFLSYKDVDGIVKSTVDTWDVINGLMFNPEVEQIACFELSVSGRTYNERKDNLRDKTIDYSICEKGDMYASELGEIYNFFETFGKRYGLTKEFRENCII